MSKAQRDKGQRGQREAADLLQKMYGARWRGTPLSGGMHMDWPYDLMKRREDKHLATPLDDTGLEVKNTAMISMPEWIVQCDEADMDVHNFSSRRWLILFKHKAKWYATMPVEELERLTKNEKKE